ncbi:MAG: hypothetical protein AABO57_16090 [Acidobacteriota bacterium]
MAPSITKTDLEAMLDPRYAKIISESFPKNASGALIVFGHEYRAPEQQENLYLELEHLVQRDPAMPIFLEGFYGPRSAWPGSQAEEGPKPTGMRKLFQRFSKPAEKPDPRNDPSWRVSRARQLLNQKGTLASEVLPQVLPEYAALFGAEEMSLLEEQQSKLKAIDARIQASLAGRIKMPTGTFFVSTFTSIFYPLVERLEGRLNDQLKQLIDLRNQFSRDARPSGYASSLAELAKSEEIDLDGYPAIQSLTDALEMERSLDFDAVEEERMELVQTLARRSDEQLDYERATAVRRWLEFAPSHEKALAEVYGEAPQEDLGMTWLTRLITISQAYKDKKYSYAQYHVRLRELMDSLGIDCPETSHLGKYIRYIVLAEQFDANALVSSELWSLHDELADIYTTSATERGILKLGAEIENLYKYVLLRLPASRVQSFLAASPSVGQWLADAYRLEQSIGAASPPDKKTMAQNAAPYIDDALPLTRDFYTLAARRSEKLIENVLKSDLVGIPVAALVCGRFHLYEMTRALRSQSRLAWAVIGPMPTRYSEERQLQTWNWIFPTQENSLAETFPEDDR